MTALSAEIELDTGPRDRDRERMCVATRTVRPVTDLIRFVVGPDGEAVPDLKHRLPGRGVWVTGTQDALGDAIKRRVFSRGFKRDVCLPADLLSRTEHLLEKAALDALAIAGKAGLSPPASSRPRRRWRAAKWSPSCMRPRPPPAGSASSMPRYAESPKAALSL